MDLGVGSFVFSSGLVSSRQRDISPIKQIFTALRSSAAILILGIVRTLLTKNLEYQVHTYNLDTADGRNMSLNTVFIGISLLPWDFCLHL